MRSEPQPPEDERWQVLHDLEDWLELPLLVLAIIWLLLLVVEVTAGLTPFLELLTVAIWVIFIGEFALRLALAPQKRRFVAHNWLVLLSLVVPAIRVFRIFSFLRWLRPAQLLRSASLVRVVGSANRSMQALGRSLKRRGFAYVMLVTVFVTLAGAAGMLSLEPGFAGYGDALWWTAMMMTTMGSDDWPVTSEGRILCFLLAVYAFATFGYVTAVIASYFVGQERRGDGD